MARGDSRRLSELTVGDAKRILVYGVALLLAASLLLLLIGKVLVALLLGIVAGVYLLPVQEWLEKRLRARSGSAVITIALIVVPLVALVGYAWYEMSGYQRLIQDRRAEIIGAISTSLSRYLPLEREGTRVAIEAAFAEAIARSAEAIQAMRKGAALLFASVALFFFTLFYVLTQRIRLTTYIKMRIPGDYLPLSEQLAKNVGDALDGALRAVLIVQVLQAFVILILNFVLQVPLAVVLAITAFIIGFIPLIGTWGIYIPVSVYLLVFRNEPISALIYLGVGIIVTFGFALFLRPKLASAAGKTFNFYWMLLALVAGTYVFGIPGVVLGPAILGFIKAVVDTLVGEVRYETSLLKSENEQHQATDEAAAEQLAANTTD